ncbi:lysophospholipid acyltransferase family protein [Mesonia sp. K7]|uniref:GNAT family N-acyltransferase n=1 Tax=Mesonia sp. K7 TaxID=2218606 RepID=UPI000DA9BD29|nr:lysophospholipid acyltransferase family protein [Mesonia sp. K7]PZD78493.1 glycerol acyltransferase [Mesonia sp. K7]
MSIVTAKEISEGLNLDKFGFIGLSMSRLVMNLTKISDANTVYNKYKHLPALEFLTAVLNHFEVNYEIADKDLKRIPKTGPFITISNHPLGAIDGIILMKTLIEQRPDYKVIANFLLHRLDPLKPYIMPVNPFEDRKDVKSSLGGLKEAINHLKEGKPFGLFPAGEVSTEKEDKILVDRPWLKEAMRLVQKSKVPVVPVYFHARNSSSFYRYAKINDALRTAKLPSEMFSQKHRKIKVRIGNPISLDDQNQYPDLKDYTAFLRMKTYLLSSGFDNKKSLLKNIESHIKIPTLGNKEPKEIVGETPEILMEKEIEFCRKNNKRLLESKNYEVFLAERKDIPNIVKEIGRLREITFRAIGEGTNNAIDIDQFDDYYHHMFLYDNETRKIAGAYRMGFGAQIFPKYGIDGFYLQQLFRFEPELHKLMSESIEMGRAFIISEYQQKPLPLFLLWKGIVHCTLRFPEHKYLIGGVSISNKFSEFSKSMMIEFMKSHYYDPYVAQYVHPKKDYKVKLKDAEKDFVFDETQADLNKFDRLIDELEPDNSLRMPVLIKKYIKQNAKVVAFNVDPLFNNSVDGLMYIRIADLPESTVKPVMEDLQAELESKLNHSDK